MLSFLKNQTCLKFYNLKIYFLAVLLNILPFIFLSKNCSGEACMVIIVGLFYAILWGVSYVPFLFIAIKKWKLTIQTERVLFFLPTGIAISITSFLRIGFPEISYPEVNSQIVAFIFIPNCILQVILYMLYLKSSTS